MNIAYFILVHRYPNQFKRLFKAIYDPDNHYLIHVDKRAGRPLYKIENYFVQSNGGFSGTPFKRPYLTNVTPYIGGQWKILSRDCKVARFKSYYGHTLIPDESFFQTVLMNTNYTKTIIRVTLIL